jgi:ABC-2 type transport system permease protein
MTMPVAVATAQRVLQQLRHDHRTVALLLGVPCVLVTLLKHVFADTDVFDRIGAPVIGVFALLSMFLVTSIAMLRERTSGTLERLLTLTMRKSDLLFGYGLAFGVLALVQASLVSALALWALGLEVSGSPALLVAATVADAMLGMSLGLFVSAFARTEFQAVQFLPAFLLPQILLCGLLTPRGNMSELLTDTSRFLPMTYAYESLSRVSSGSGGAGGYLLITFGFGIVALLAGSATLRRRST